MIKHMFDKLDEEHKNYFFCEILSHLDDEKKHDIYISMARIVNHGHLSPEEADKWVNSMGPKGKHWSKEEASAHNSHHYNECDWYAVLNMMYNDYYGAVTDTTDSYVRLANAWFDDKDLEEPDHKTFDYYHYIVKK